MTKQSKRKNIKIKSTENNLIKPLIPTWIK